MAADDVKVLYILGQFRSGTTVLSNLLGQIPGFFCVGELRTIWRELQSEGRCGCGEPILDCPVWRNVLATTFGSDADVPALAHQMLEWQTAALGQRRTWMRTWGLLRDAPSVLQRDSPARSYATVLGTVYRAIANHPGVEVVVDSSKEPSDAALLRSMMGVRPAYVHLVRDPRGTVNSIRKAHARQGLASARPALLADALAAGGWCARNTANGAVRTRAERSVLVRYEDLMGDLPTTLTGIAGLFDQEPDLGFLDGRTAIMRPTHSVDGNENRFRTGSVELVSDSSWTSELGRSDRWTITALCSPLMLRYGYRARAPRS